MTRRKADWDSPAAITLFTSRSPSGLVPVGCRIACAACEKMSYEKLSPGWTSDPYRRSQEND
ncbi:MAG: hypothetical protein E6J71_27750 [Deltaproteobacteria bacterium]|nr:MAG: hypothetical protein E6J71_27750 [Deltaproteobacteria bacterium]